MPDGTGAMVENLVVLMLVVPGIIGLTVSASLVFYAAETHRRMIALVVSGLLLAHILIVLSWW